MIHLSSHLPDIMGVYSRKMSVEINLYSCYSTTVPILHGVQIKLLSDNVNVLEVAATHKVLIDLIDMMFNKTRNVMALLLLLESFVRIKAL
jgi:hypothetical protein